MNAHCKWRKNDPSQTVKTVMKQRLSHELRLRDFAHLQSVTLVLPGLEVELDRHCEQGDDPSTSLYDPDAHGLQAYPSSPVKP